MYLVRRVILLWGVLAAVAQAQQPPPNILERQGRVQELQRLELDNRLHANPDVPPTERALIDYGGYVTASYLSLDDAQNNNHGLRQYDLVGFLRVQLDGASEVLLRARTGYRDFNEGDSFDGQGDEKIDPDFDRAYYRVDFNSYRTAYGGKSKDTDVIFKGGRDLAYWGNGLVLTEVLDGVVVDVASPSFDLQLLGGVTPTRTLDIDPSRPSFYYNTRRGFLGGMLTARGQTFSPYVYGLIQRDYNKDEELTTGAVTTNFDYNSEYLGVGASGNLSDRLRYGVEFAYELGNTLSNSFTIANGTLNPVPQTRDDIGAWGLDLLLNYLVQDAHQSRLSAELIVASGDSDRGSTSSTFNGNKPGTTDNAFNAFGLLNTGLAFAPVVSNISALRVGASTFPFGNSDTLRRFQLGADFFVYCKTQSDAPIDETTLDQRFLGTEPDIYLNWQIASDITLALRYGVFFPNSAAFPGNDDIRQFFYAGVTLAF